MTSLITVTRIQDLQSFETLRPDWDRILSQSQNPDIFLSWEWMFSWWKNIGRHKNELWLLVVRDGERVIGIVPLMRNTKTKALLRLKKLENIGNPDCDVAGMITLDAEITATAITKYLRANSASWDILELKELPYSNHETHILISSIKAAGYKLREAVEKHFYISCEENWEEYYSRLSKNLKHNFSRRMRRAGELGEVRYERYAGDSLSWEHFETIFEISKRSNFPYLYMAEHQRSFHEDLFAFMQARNWIQIEILTIGGKPVAFQYGFIYDGRYEDWRGGFDKDYEFVAPGKLLMMLSLEARFTTGFKENDFLRGNHAYKTDWLPKTKDFMSLQVFNTQNIKPLLAYYWLNYIKRKSSAEAEKHNG